MKVYPTIYSQQDPRWANKELGSQAGATIGQLGCYDTSFAMKACYYGKQTDPASLDDAFTAGNVFVNADLLTDDALNKIYGDIQYVESDHYETIPADLQKLKGYAQDNTITVTLCIAVGSGYHFVELVDCDGTTVTIANPWTGKIENFTSLYGSPTTNILRFIVYKGPAPVPMMQVPQSTYTNLVTKASNFDAVATALKIDPLDTQGGVKAVTTINTLKTDDSTKDTTIANLNSQISQLTSDKALLADNLTQCQSTVEANKDCPANLLSMTTNFNQVTQDYETAKGNWTSKETSYVQQLKTLQTKLDNALVVKPPTGPLSSFFYKLGL